ncbi:hypothetical protein ACI6QG_05375 [Roseococcus sp. DSY-14]|uniref:RraA family protein n=1 Tax=Roseococcus sp. DSY-14 TaxID=3369650 RepID=UPI00387A8E3A
MTPFEIIEELKERSTANVSDALDALVLHAAARSCKPLRDCSQMATLACTLPLRSKSAMYCPRLHAGHMFKDARKPREPDEDIDGVLVVAGEIEAEICDLVCSGYVRTKAATKRGLAGTTVDSLVRCLEDFETIGHPICACGAMVLVALSPSAPPNPRAIFHAVYGTDCVVRSARLPGGPPSPVFLPLPIPSSPGVLIMTDVLTPGAPAAFPPTRVRRPLSREQISARDRRAAGLRAAATLVVSTHLGLPTVMRALRFHPFAALPYDLLWSAPLQVDDAVWHQAAREDRHTLAVAGEVALACWQAAEGEPLDWETELELSHEWDAGTRALLSDAEEWETVEAFLRAEALLGHCGTPLRKEMLRVCHELMHDQ